jgi:hypothetical protein
VYQGKSFVNVSTTVPVTRDLTLDEEICASADNQPVKQIEISITLEIDTIQHFGAMSE